MAKSKKSAKSEQTGKKNTFLSVFLHTLSTIFKILIPLAFLVGVILVIFIIAGAEKLDIDDLALDLTSAVCYIDEEGEIQEYEKVASTGNRYWVPLNKVPKNMQEAFISIEDERFRSHNGVDIKRTAKAVFQYIFDRNNAHGGSTITQQLIKNLTGNDDRSPVRKVQEMWMAFQLERKMSKDQILELYVNTIYLAQGVNGVQTASKLYFDKDVSELSLAECASIAGITQTPALYDPFLNPENNKKKQELVLYKMLELGKITQEEHDAAVAEELNFKKGNMRVSVPSQSYFTEQVITDAIAALVKQKGMSETVAKRKITNGGYKIISTLDPKIQSAINDVFSSESNFPKSPVSPAPQGAITVIDVHTGEIKGLYGGIGPKPGAYVLNRATGSYRQPGSSIKPLAVYAPAIDKGLITPQSIYTDKKVTYGDWSPKNFYTGFKGDMTVRAAVQLSVNTIAVQIVDELGTDVSYDYLKNKFKLSNVTESDKVLGALGLGGLTTGTSVTDMAAAYSAFPNDGIYNSPITFTKIIDSTGKVILKNKSESSSAVSKSTAATMNDLLHGVVTSGTGTGANISGITIAGKTGTTDNNVDKWFVGYTADYCAAVWYGYDTQKPMNHVSGNPAVTAWKKVMQPVLKNISSNNKLDVTYQTNNKTVEICTISGLIPSDYCRAHNTVKAEQLAPSAIPTETCSANKHTAVEELDPETAETPTQSNGIQTPVTGNPSTNTTTPQAPSGNQPTTPEQNSGNTNQGGSETTAPPSNQTTPTTPQSPENGNVEDVLSELEQIIGND